MQKEERECRRESENAEGARIQKSEKQRRARRRG
jgi:hypothetical protein